MPWYVYLSYFFGGAFLANAVPHFVNGISGRPFRTPFASPPGKGLSSPLINVLWGSFNVAMGYLLVGRVGDIQLSNTLDILPLGTGALLLSVMLARTFGHRASGLQN